MSDAILANPLRRLSCSQASRVTGVSRHVISAAMDVWVQTKGRAGLRFSIPERRRMTSVQALRDWLTNLERQAADGY